MNSAALVPVAPEVGVVLVDDSSPQRRSYATLHALYGQALRDAQLAWDERAAAVTQVINVGRDLAIMQRQVADANGDAAAHLAEIQRLRRRTVCLDAQVVELGAVVKGQQAALEEMEALRLRAAVAEAAREAAETRCESGDAQRTVAWPPHEWADICEALRAAFHAAAPGGVPCPPIDSPRAVCDALQGIAARIREQHSEHDARYNSLVASSESDAKALNSRIMSLTESSENLRKALQSSHASDADTAQLRGAEVARAAEARVVQRVVAALPMALLRTLRGDDFEAPATLDDAVGAVRDVGLLCLAQEQDALAERDRVLSLEATRQAELVSVTCRLKELERELSERLATRMRIATVGVQVDSACDSTATATQTTLPCCEASAAQHHQKVTSAASPSRVELEIARRDAVAATRKASWAKQELHRVAVALAASGPRAGMRTALSRFRVAALTVYSAVALRHGCVKRLCHHQSGEGSPVRVRPLSKTVAPVVTAAAFESARTPPQNRVLRSVNLPGPTIDLVAIGGRARSMTPETVDVLIHRCTSDTSSRFVVDSREPSWNRASPARSPPSIERTADRGSSSRGRCDTPPPRGVTAGERSPSTHHLRCEACAQKMAEESFRDSSNAQPTPARFNAKDAAEMLTRAATIGRGALRRIAPALANRSSPIKGPRRSDEAQCGVAGTSASMRTVASSPRRSASSFTDVSFISSSANTSKRDSRSMLAGAAHRSVTPNPTVAADLSLEILSVISALDRRVEVALASSNLHR